MYLNRIAHLLVVSLQQSERLVWQVTHNELVSW